MTDPFEALATPVEPLDPGPDLTARLRRRIETALARPEGTEMPGTVREPEPLAVSVEGATALAGVTPYLAVADARAALAWYIDVLGARLRREPIELPDGRIGHAELALAGDVVMLADEHPEIGHTAPVAGLGSSVTLHLEVADVDVTTREPSPRAPDWTDLRLTTPTVATR